MPSSSAFCMDSSSLMLPPGCTMAVTPYLAASSTVSPNGRKPSEASTSPSVKPAALAWLSAISAEPTLFVCPAPTPSVRLSRTTTIALDLTCFTIFQPNSRSFIWDPAGFALVTHISGVTLSMNVSSCWTSIPPLTPVYWVTGPSRSEEHTSELQSPDQLVCRLLLEKKKKNERVAMVCNTMVEELERERVKKQS